MKKIILIIMSFLLAASSLRVEAFSCLDTYNTWYENKASQVQKMGIMGAMSYNGIEPLFKGDEYLSRGMLVTILYRMANAPKTNYQHQFVDVGANVYYEKALNWACANNIVHGYDKFHFGGDDPITREQLAIILYNYCPSQVNLNCLDKFNDVNKLNDYSLIPMAFLVENNFIEGSNNNLMPLKGATRGECAKILLAFYRYLHQNDNLDNQLIINNKPYIVDNNLTFDLCNEEKIIFPKGISFYMTRKEVIASYGKPLKTSINDLTMDIYELDGSYLHLYYDNNLLIKATYANEELTNKGIGRLLINQYRNNEGKMIIEYNECNQQLLQVYELIDYNYQLIHEEQVDGSGECLIDVSRDKNRIIMACLNANDDKDVYRVMDIVYGKNIPLVIDGLTKNYNLNACDDFYLDINLNNASKRTLFLQMNIDGKWETCSEYQLNDETKSLTLDFKDWWYLKNIEHSKWRLYSCEDEINQEFVYEFTINTKRYYQNNNSLLPIKTNISLGKSSYELSYGYMGLKVQAVQLALGMGHVWEQYGNATVNKVKAFQQSHNLKVDGIVGRNTWNALGLSDYDFDYMGSYVSPSKIHLGSSKEECIQAMVDRAFEYLGTEYVVGASGKVGQGVDCSGLIMQCLYAAGIDLSPINPIRHSKPGYEFESYNIYNDSRLKSVALNSIEKGDLVFYYNANTGNVNHIALYIGNNQVIDSWIDDKGVAIRPLNGEGRGPIKGIKRVFQ